MKIQYYRFSESDLIYLKYYIQIHGFFPLNYDVKISIKGATLPPKFDNNEAYYGMRPFLFIGYDKTNEKNDVTSFDLMFCRRDWRNPIALSKFHASLPEDELS